MADSFYVLQLALPCTLAEAVAWWEEVKRVLAEDSAAGVNVIAHADGHYRLTVALQEEVSG